MAAKYGKTISSVMSMSRHKNEATLSIYLHDLERERDPIENYIEYWKSRPRCSQHRGTTGPLEKQVDMAIQPNLTVLLLLSENSVQSDLVEHEVRKARDLAKELNRDVLCPVALDDSWQSSPWPERIMEQVMEYNILDFSKWEDESVFEKQFRKLLDELDLFYK